MASLSPVMALFEAQPLLAYALLSAVFLFTVALGSGWSRRDVLALLSLRGLLHLILAVALAVGLYRLSADFVQLTATDHLVLLSSFLGLSRLPLYLLTLAYGPSSGLVAAVLLGLLVPMSSLALSVWILELTVLGYLAIAPSPFQYRFAASLNIIMAFALTQATAGIALLVTQVELSLASFWSLQASQLGGVVVSALLLLWLRPIDFRLVFPDSRIMPRQYQASVISLPDQLRSFTRLQHPQLPRAVRSPLLSQRRRDAKQLESFPFETTRPYQLSEDKP